MRQETVEASAGFVPCLMMPHQKSFCLHMAVAVEAVDGLDTTQEPAAEVVGLEAQVVQEEPLLP